MTNRPRNSNIGQEAGRGAPSVTVSLRSIDIKRPNLHWVTKKAKVELSVA